MKELTVDDLQNLNLEDILKVRKDLEQYLGVIDEYVITSKTDLEGTITYASKAFEKISGYTSDELLGKSHNIIRHPDMNSDIFEDLWDTIVKQETWSGEIKNKRKDGSYYWVITKITPTYDFDGNHIGYTSVRQDITDKKRFEEVSLVDELTGLFNRRHYNQIITKEIHRAIRDKKVFCYLLLDIDYFKKYNDKYGHKKGDIALEKVGLLLKKCFKRATDIVFRLGGEEFCIIYTTQTNSQGIDLAQNLSESLEELAIEHELSDISKHLTASIGLAVCNFQTEDIEDIVSEVLYDKADKALYEAKSSGRNQIKEIIVK